MEPPPSSQMKPPPTSQFQTAPPPSSQMQSPSPMESPPSSPMKPPPSSQFNPSREPPPSSQSHFDTFTNFTPNPSAPFDDEFARLASSQNWIPGSQSYVQERTIAMRTELKLHYFSQSQSQDSAASLTPEEELQGFQKLCGEIGIPPSATVEHH